MSIKYHVHFRLGSTLTDTGWPGATVDQRAEASHRRVSLIQVPHFRSAVVDPDDVLDAKFRIKLATQLCDLTARFAIVMNAMMSVAARVGPDAHLMHQIASGVDTEDRGGACVHSSRGC